MSDKASIIWPFHNQEPTNIRSKEHQLFLINSYNKGKSKKEQVKTMSELIQALKNEK